MEINLEEIKNAISDLINGKITREEITDWAVSLERLNDEMMLDFENNKDKKVILNAIFFLTAADLKVSPKNYFHPMEDFVEYLKTLTE